MINDLLDMAKMEHAVFSFNFQEFNFIQTILGVFQSLEYHADAKKINLLLHLDEIQPSLLGCVIGDERRLSQILINFLSNSIKFTRKGGFVKLKLRVL
jgi:signal transduction histidine kinase